MYELKIYRGVLCHDNEEWCKIWRGINLSVQNWHEEFDKFLPKQKGLSSPFSLARNRIYIEKYFFLLDTFKEWGCNFVVKDFRKFLFQNSGVQTTSAKKWDKVSICISSFYYFQSFVMYYIGLFYVICFF